MAQSKQYIIGKFEAGDRPTDQDFNDLFSSILFIDNEGGDPNGSVNTNTSLLGDFTLGGGLDMGGTLNLPQMRIGDPTDSIAMLDRTISAYNYSSKVIIYASGSSSPILFEGINASSTASIQLEDNQSKVRFGTHTGTAFIELDGNEYFNISDSGGAKTFISGSVGIDIQTPTEKLHIKDTTTDTRVMVETTTGNSIFKTKTNTSNFSLVGRGDTNKLEIQDANVGETPITIHGGNLDNTLVLKGSKIGMGTSTPTKKLHISDNQSEIALFYSTDATSHIRVERSNNTTIDLMAGATAHGSGLLSSHEMMFSVAGNSITAPSMTIETDGKVGIGTKSPISLLNVHTGGVQPTNQPGNLATFQQATLSTYAASIAVISGNTASTSIFFGDPDNMTMGGVRYDNDDNSMGFRTNGIDHRMSITSAGNVGIGTTSPSKTLSVKGNMSIENANGNVIIFNNANSVATVPDILFGGSGLLAAESDFIIAIDSNAGGSPRKFSIVHDAANTTGAELFKVEEDGTTTSTAFVGDGSGLTNITAGNITNLITPAASNNQIITSTGAVNSLKGETNLTFDGTNLELGAGYIKFPLVTNTSPLHSLPNTNTMHTALFMDMDGDDSYLEYGHLTAGETFTQFRLRDNSTGDVFRIYFDDWQGDAYDKIPFEVEGSIVKLVQDGGLVGIGTSNPIYELDAYDSDGGSWIRSRSGGAHDTGLQVENTTSRWYMYTGATSNKFYIKDQTSATYPLVIEQGTPSNTLYANSYGKVGIGTSSPGAVLHIDGGSANTSHLLKFQSKDDTGDMYMSWYNNTGTRVGYLGYGSSSTNDFSINQEANAPMLFMTNGSERVRILAGGNVGIGLNLPTAQLHVQDTAADGVVKDILILESTCSDVIVAPSGPSLVFKHQDGNNAVNEARIKVLTTNTGGGAYDVFGNQNATENENNMVFTTMHNGTEYDRMTIGFDGQVGIGVLDPNTRLAVKTDISIVNSDYNPITDVGSRLIIGLGAASGDTYSWMQAQDQGSISNNNLSLQRYGGNVGIGNTNPSYMLDVSGHINVRSGHILMDEDQKIEWSTADNDYAFITARRWSSNSGYLELGTRDDGTEPIIFTQNAAGTVTERMRISNHVWVPNKLMVSDFTTNSAPTCNLTINSTTAQSWDGGIGLERQGVMLGKIIADTEGVKYRTWAPGDNHYFRNSANETTLCIKDNGHVILGGNDPTTNINLPMGLVDSDVGAYLEIQNEGTNGDSALLGVFSAGQGDGIVFVGQDMNHGGGIIYKGDATAPSPLSNITLTDRITLFRTTSTVTHPVMSFSSASDDVRFEGTIGIRMSPNTGYPIAIKQTVEHAGILMYDYNSSNYWTMGLNSANSLHFRYNGSSRGYLLSGSDVDQITFTGQHKNIPLAGSSQNYKNHIGKIVISTGTYYNLNKDISKESPTINESLPKIALSTTINDKKVWGVVSSAEDSTSTTREENSGVFVSTIEKEDDRVWVNSVGEGAVLITNINGNLENGDYITTSAIEGLGMKQDDDLLHNYTVAKITQDCNFATGTTDIIHNGTTYKMKLVGCTYHCG